ncbi:MAG: DUF5119 domain-containing protein [Bacteroidetes bacterium]|nr:DUF5119 domain-containing protein [Candidatus Colenecus caballi]
MTNVRNNRTLAKIQIILGLSMFLLMNSACERKDLFLRVDQTQIQVELFDISLDLLWGIDWQAEWQYSWNESISTYGQIGYSQPELIKGTIYNVDPATNKRFSSFFKIFDKDGGRLSLTAGSRYDMMFYNFGTEWTSFHQSEDFETYTASTRASSNSSWIRTRAENEFSEMPSDKSYIDYNQPDELFGTLVTGLEINEDPSSYETEYDEDGNIRYVYKIDANLRPYSFIYLFQIIVLNNNDGKGNRVTGARGLTATGLSQGVDLFSRKTFNSTISITSEDIKPMQNHSNVRLADGSTVENADIMASRMLTWGLPGINPLENTKARTRAVEYDQNYLGIGLTLRNGYTFTITQNITDQMHEKPAGGVITIYIDANDIPEDLLEKKQQTSGGGFNASVTDWENEINAEVTI